MPELGIGYTLGLKNLFKPVMNDAIKQTGQMDKKVDGLQKKVNNLKTSFGGLGSTIAGAFSIYSVGRFGMAIVDSLKKQEYFAASVKTMLHGNADAAEALQNQLIGLAKTTPFSLEEVQASTKQLLAYGFAAGKITDDLKTLGDVSAGVGQPISEIVYLYGTLKTQGRAFAKDIYQFTGRGIPIVRELAKQFGVTDSKVMDLVKDGKVGFKEIEKAFKAMTSAGGQFFNLMADQSKTVGGKISNLGDVWEQLKVNIGKSQRGIIASTVGWADKMVNALNNTVASRNFRDEAIKKIAVDQQLTNYTTTSDHRRDKQYAAYSGTYKTGQRRYFESDLEREDFLNSKEGKGFNAGEEIGTQERFNKFSDKFFTKINDLAALPENKQVFGRVDLLKEVRGERETILKQLQQSRISSDLAGNELAVLDKVISNVKGLTAIAKMLPEKPQKDTNDPNADSSIAGIESNMNRPQNLTVNIAKLGETTINTETLKESKTEVKEFILQTMIEALNDVNYMDRLNGR